MELELEYTNPYELTLSGRVGLDEAEEANPLAAALPSQHTFGQSITVYKGGNGFNEVAEFRSYDAEASFGDSGKDLEEIEVKLPAIGQQSRVSELDQLKIINTGDRTLLEDMRLSAAKKRGKAVADRMELARGQVIETGKATINENRFKKEIDFDRDPSMTITAGTLWSEQTGDLLDQIDQWVAEYAELNGFAPAGMLGAERIRRAVKGHDSVRAAIHGSDSKQRVTSSQLQDFLTEEGLPSFTAYDKQFRKGGKPVRAISDNVLVFLPPVQADAGVTAWGTTLESLEPDYSIPVGERPGIVVAAMKSRNPIGVYAHAAAIGLPVLKNANAFMAATVL